MNRPYSRDSLLRALNHHELVTKLVTFVGRPEPGRPNWRIRVVGQGDTYEFTSAQIYAVCVVLAGIERASRESENLVETAHHWWEIPPLELP